MKHSSPRCRLDPWEVSLQFRISPEVLMIWWPVRSRRWSGRFSSRFFPSFSGSTPFPLAFHLLSWLFEALFACPKCFWWFRIRFWGSLTHLGCTFYGFVVDNDALNNGVVSFSSDEGQLDLVVGESVGNFDSLEVDSISFNFNLNVFFMSCVFLACILYHIEIFPDNFRPDFDIEHSLALLGEVHLNEVNFTSANLRMRVFFPFLTGKLYVISS